MRCPAVAMGTTSSICLCVYACVCVVELVQVSRLWLECCDCAPGGPGLVWVLRDWSSQPPLCSFLLFSLFSSFFFSLLFSSFLLFLCFSAFGLNDQTLFSALSFLGCTGSFSTNSASLLLLRPPVSLPLPHHTAASLLTLSSCTLTAGQKRSTVGGLGGCPACVDTLGLD